MRSPNFCDFVSVEQRRRVARQGKDGNGESSTTYLSILGESLMPHPDSVHFYGELVPLFSKSNQIISVPGFTSGDLLELLCKAIVVVKSSCLESSVLSMSS